MFTLYSMIKIWNEAFLKKQPDNDLEYDKANKLTFSEGLPSIILGLISILMGIFAYSVFNYTMEAANQLIKPDLYINSVLNK
jgi:multicomponent Na+:H+ antiporter subunit D